MAIIGASPLFDSADNCIAAAGAGVDIETPTGAARTPTTFANNWWGAPSGPSGAGGGSGSSVDAIVTFAPFSTAPSTYCGFDRVFVDGFDR